MEGKRVRGTIKGFEDGEEGEGESSGENAKGKNKRLFQSSADADDIYGDEEAGTPHAIRTKNRRTGTSQDLTIEPGDANDNGEDGPTLLAAPETDSEWQPKSTYDLSQTTQGLELTNEDRHTGADLEQPADESQEEDMVAVEIEETGEKVDPRAQADKHRMKSTTKTGKSESKSKGDGPQDKEARKRAKKLRGKEERSQKEEGRKKKDKKTK